MEDPSIITCPRCSGQATRSQWKESTGEAQDAKCPLCGATVRRSELRFYGRWVLRVVSEDVKNRPTYKVITREFKSEIG